MCRFFFHRENVTVRYTSLTGPLTVILRSLYYSSDAKLCNTPLMKYTWHIGVSETDGRHIGSEFKSREVDELFH